MNSSYKILNCNLMNLKIDPTRWINKEYWEKTGIYIRAQLPDGGWETADIAHLDRASLLSWLKSAGGDNRIAENCVGVLLGYGHLHENPPSAES